jgi:hypothetical protein
MLLARKTLQKLPSRKNKLSRRRDRKEKFSRPSRSFRTNVILFFFDLLCFCNGKRDTRNHSILCFMHNFAVAFKRESYINIIIDDSKANGSQLLSIHSQNSFVCHKVRRLGFSVSPHPTSKLSSFFMTQRGDKTRM